MKHFVIAITRTCGSGGTTIAKMLANDYQIDRDRIYLVGHSMGGQTVLNATRRLPFVKATVAAATFNLAKLFRMGREEEFQTEILPMGQILRTEEKDALLKDARENYRQLDI